MNCMLCQNPILGENVKVQYHEELDDISIFIKCSSCGNTGWGKLSDMDFDWDKWDKEWTYAETHLET